MRKKRVSLTNRLLAVVLSVVMVFSMMPSLGVSAQTGMSPTGITGIVADAPTLDSWESAFDPVNVSTEHAGGIWTDKSVLTTENLSALGLSGMTIGANNFLVALSALASNSVIMGQGAMPTDTVFVLDISGSMSTSELRSMVAAANSAIHSLLGGDGSTNRVGIVLYSDDVSTLLPLDRYTPVVDGGVTEYIELYQNDSTNYIRAAQAQVVVESGGNGGSSSGGFWDDFFDWITGGNGGGSQTQTVYLKNGNGDNVTTSVRTTGGTYIQGGLWQAMELFEPAQGTAVSGRTPALVLMSDGAPTYTTNRFSNVPGEPSHGAGSSSTDADGFVTQLTAAYVKNQIKQWYGGADAYLYTLGLGVDNVTDSDVAKEFLDPNGQTHSGMEALWTEYQALTAGETMEVALGNTRNNNLPSVAYNATVAQMGTTYVDEYFSAAQASDLATAFQKIVNQINLQSGYYVTRLDSENANLGGYVTFIDEIGTGMQIKEIKGIQIGTTLYSGRVLAAALENGLFGSEEQPTALGDNMVWALKERLGLTDTAQARQLLAQAYANGQLHYDATTGAFSNYIGWYGDSNGDFVAFWDAEDPNAEIPAGAVFANKCYGMLGSTTTDQTIHASDMMYITIQVSKRITDGKILDKTPEQVTFRVPVSLLPVVTYQIELDSQNMDTATKATVTYQEAEPIRLLYEVGVHEKLNAINIHEFLRTGYQAKDKDTGHYYLYTNAWNWEGADADDWQDKNTHPQKDNAVGAAVLPDTSKNAITYAYFEPGEDNEHYYFTKNTQIYVKDGENYTALTTAPTSASGEYYYKHTVYTTAEADGMESHYGKLSQAAVQAAMDANSAYVPKGTLHHYEQTHSHDRDKDDPATPGVDENATGSFFAVRHHLVNARVNGSDLTQHAYELVYMGNNGRVTYAPAQGIAISKEMADGSTPAVDFTFDVTLTAPAGVTLAGQYTTYSAETDTYGTVNVDTNGKAVVTLKPGQTLYIMGLPTGTTYTVTERRNDGYLQSDATAGATGTVTANQVSKARFVNRVRGVGSLNVYKTVTYNKGASKTAASADNKFTVTVTVTDGDVRWNGTAKVNGVDAPAVNGVITFEIADGETVSITNLPEGYTYQVAEDTANLPKGYAYVGGNHLTDVITTEATAAALRNSYTPDGITISSTDPEIELQISKILNDAAGNPVDPWQSDFKFEFQLLRYENGGWVDKQVSIDNITIKGQIVTTSLAGQPFNAVGEYLFRVSEKPGTRLGMAYDTTDHDFRVYVTDTNLDGKLEISKVEIIDPLETKMIKDGAADGDGKWIIGTEFTNIYQMNSANWTPSTAKKTLSGREMKDGEFLFTLYRLDGQVRTKISTVSCGKEGDIHFPAQVFTQAGTYTYIVVEEVPAGVDANNRKNGVTYDRSEYQVVVTVAEGGTGASGQLVVTDVTRTLIKDAAGNAVDQTVTQVSFTNEYKAAPATSDLAGNKTLTNLTPGLVGTDMTAGIAAGDYTFVLKMVGGEFKRADSAAPDGYVLVGEDLISVGNGGSFRYGGLYFDQAGTYQFTLTEAAVTKPGVTKDSSEYQITVVVEDNGEGALKVTSVSYTQDGVPVERITFRNTYKAEATAPLTLSGNKQLLDRPIRYPMQAGEFGFTLTGPFVANGSQTVRNESNGNFAFSSLTFDTVGTYEYTVTELHGGDTIQGVTYDPARYTVTVEVTDDGSGKLTATPTYKKDNAPATGIAFTNTYGTQPVKVQLTGRKNLVGRPDGLKENEFSFTLVGPYVTNGSETKKNDANGLITFSELTFNTAGTWAYTIVENVPQTDKVPGVTYDETVHQVSITVTDNGKGQLVANVSIPNQDAEDVDFRFFNSYKAEKTDPVVLGGEKTLTGRPVAMKDGEFSFLLKDKDGNIIEKVENDGERFAFTGLVFDSVGVYTYTIEEENGGQKIDGVRYDDRVYTVTINVVDDSTGKLKAESIVYTVGGQTAQKPVFENTYKAAPVTNVVIEANKVLTDITGGGNGNLTPKDGDFTFALKHTTGYLVEEVSNVGGKVTFTGLDYDTAATYLYVITEVKGDKAGITYDETAYNVVVKVTDPGDGQLVATVEYKKGETAVEPDEVVFRNTYKAKDAQLNLIGKKTLTGGRVLKEGEFSFVLKGSDGKAIETVKNGANGAFAFEALTFDKAGTYEYTISEIAGSDSQVKYDDTVYKITVTVTYENGKLNAVATVDGQPAGEFGYTNIFTPAAVSVNITAEKKVTNHTAKVMGVDGFTFRLTDGQKEITAVSGTDGLAKFALEYTAADIGKTYTYKLSEVKGEIADMTYDETVYEITVTVSQDATTGELKVAVSRTENAVFTNVYGTYEEPPKTGDSFQMTLWTAMLSVSALAMLAVLVIGKQKLQLQ